MYSTYIILYQYVFARTHFTARRARADIADRVIPTSYTREPRLAQRPRCAVRSLLMMNN